MKKPNIIYILADDMGYGDVSCLNPKCAWKTPHFDRLGREGAIFTDGHSSSAVCTPSRYSILTGRYNWRSRLKKSVLGGYHPALIEEKRLTVAGLCRAQGYRTACVGKWHLGMNWEGLEARDEKSLPGDFRDPGGVDYAAPFTGGPVDHGFDYYWGIAASLDMPPYLYLENDRATELPDHVSENTGKMPFWRPGPTGPSFRHEEVLQNLTDKACELIDRWADEPFFIYFPIPAPHTPILPTGRFVGASGTNAYGDFCLMCDDVVGQVLAKLEAKGIADNTLIIYTSDNGCSPSADFPALARFGHNPSHVFRGHKADIYEGGHRVPLLMRWPDGIKAGTVVDETVCLTDLMATLAELFGVALPADAGEDSVSNLALWRGEKRPTPLREATVHHSIDGSFSIRKGPWKLELCPGSGGWSDPVPGKEAPGAPPIQLYDLRVDIGERKNLEAERPEIVRELKTLLATYISSGRSTPGAPQKNTGPEWWDKTEWARAPAG